MKKLLAFLSIFCFSFLMIQNVEAGTLSWKNYKRISSNTFEFYLEANDIDLNYVSGTWDVSHGKIIDITMHDGWINKSGTENKFYYYHDGIKSGNYKIATVKIRLTDDSKTSINYLNMGTHTCHQDAQSNYFNKNGNLTDEAGYKNSCFSSDATLSSLAISNGTLTPSFQSNIENYQATVDSNISSVSFLPIRTNSKAKVISGTTCNLNPGKNNCQIIVEAESGARKTYTVEVTRKNTPVEPPKLSDDATLKSLTSDHGNFTTAFKPEIVTYNVKVDNNIEIINFTAIPNHEKAKVLSGTTCNLNIGKNTCKIVVESESKKQLVYTINVTKTQTDDDLQNDTSIKDLAVNNGTLKEEFNPEKKEYTIDILEGTNVISLQYTFNANNLNYTIPFEIKEDTTYIELVINSLNHQKKDIYRFNINIIKKEDNNTPSTPTPDTKPDSKPNVPSLPNTNPNEIENPQTGILLNFKTILILIGLTVIGIICYKKKNIIPKL